MKLDKQGKLNTYFGRCCAFFGVWKDLPEKNCRAFGDLQKKYTNKHMKINTMKLFLDGTNESGKQRLAFASSERIRPGTKLRRDQDGNGGTEKIASCFATKEGLDMHIHLVGDRSFRVACDAAEAAQKEAKKAGEAWRMQIILAHCETG